MKEKIKCFSMANLVNNPFETIFKCKILSWKILGPHRNLNTIFEWFLYQNHEMKNANPNCTKDLINNKCTLIAKDLKSTKSKIIKKLEFH